MYTSNDECSVWGQCLGLVLVFEIWGTHSVGSSGDGRVEEMVPVVGVAN